MKKLNKSTPKLMVQLLGSTSQFNDACPVRLWREPLHVLLGLAFNQPIDSNICVEGHDLNKQTVFPKTLPKKSQTRRVPRLKSHLKNARSRSCQALATLIKSQLIINNYRYDKIIKTLKVTYLNVASEVQIETNSNFLVRVSVRILV